MISSLANAPLSRPVTLPDPSIANTHGSPVVPSQTSVAVTRSLLGRVLVDLDVHRDDPVLVLGASAMSWSSTGPQYRLWQRAGVANIAMTGLPFPMTWSSDTWWNEHGAGFDRLSVRVQSGSVPSVSRRRRARHRGAGVADDRRCRGSR